MPLFPSRFYSLYLWSSWRQTLLTDDERSSRGGGTEMSTWASFLDVLRNLCAFRPQGSLRLGGLLHSRTPRGGSFHHSWSFRRPGASALNESSEAPHLLRILCYSGIFLQKYSALKILLFVSSCTDKVMSLWGGKSQIAWLLFVLPEARRCIYGAASSGLQVFCGAAARSFRSKQDHKRAVSLSPRTNQPTSSYAFFRMCSGTPSPPPSLPGTKVIGGIGSETAVGPLLAELPQQSPLILSLQ